MPEHRQGRREGVPAFLFNSIEAMSRASSSSAPSAQARGGKMEGASPRQFSQAPPALRWRSVAASVLRFPETEDLPCSGRVSGNAHKGRNGTEQEHLRQMRHSSQHFSRGSSQASTSGPKYTSRSSSKIHVPRTPHNTTGSTTSASCSANSRTPPTKDAT